MPRKPKIWFDYDYLFGLQDEAAPKEVFFLSEPAQQVLSQLAEMVLWQTRWYNGDEADTTALAASIYEELKVPAHFDDLIPYVDEIEDLLKALKFQAGCCGENDPSGGTLYTEDVVDGTGDVPQNVIDAGYATGASDWTGYADYKCMVAHIAVHDLEAKLRKLAPYIDNAGEIIGGLATLIGIITTLWSGGLTAIAGGILATTAAAATLYELLTSSTIATDLADAIAADHDGLACAIYQSDGTDDAVSDLKAYYDANFTTAQALILDVLNWEPGLRAALVGYYDAQDIAQILADKGYDTADYDCTCVTPVSQITWTFDTDAEGWTKQADGTPQNWVSDRGSPDVGCLAVGEFDDCLSPTFVCTAYSSVNFNWKMRTRASTARGRMILRRASDDTALHVTGEHTAGGSWETENETETGSGPSESVYIEFDGLGGYPDIDTIQITFNA